MSEPWEYEQEAAEDAFRERLFDELGPQWAEGHGFAPYEDAIKEFTAERLKSYFVANPNLAGSASDSLIYAHSLMPSYPEAALVFATTAMDLAVKTVLLKPIVFGLVHTEGLATLITELTTQHTGMERFRNLLTGILAQFGGVDLRTFTREGATRTLWHEISEVQKARNAVVHRGESAAASTANLAIAVAGTILHEIFPMVLAKLDLHLHEPVIVCGERHGTRVNVYFPVDGIGPSIRGWAEIDLDDLDFDAVPEAIAGKLDSQICDDDLLVLRSAGEVPMWFTSMSIKYLIRVAPDSRRFKGTREVPLNLRP